MNMENRAEKITLIILHLIIVVYLVTQVVLAVCAFTGAVKMPVWVVFLPTLVSIGIITLGTAVAICAALRISD